MGTEKSDFNPNLQWHKNNTFMSKTINSGKYELLTWIHLHLGNIINVFIFRIWWLNFWGRSYISLKGFRGTRQGEDHNRTQAEIRVDSFNKGIYVISEAWNKERGTAHEYPVAVTPGDNIILKYGPQSYEKIISSGFKSVCL